jgi:hypothetical protein
VPLLYKSPENLVKLVGGVIRELEKTVEPRPEARVRLEERLHWPGVSCDDDDEPVTIVFHELEQSVNRFAAEIDL